MGPSAGSRSRMRREGERRCSLVAPLCYREAWGELLLNVEVELWGGVLVVMCYISRKL